MSLYEIETPQASAEEPTTFTPHTPLISAKTQAQAIMNDIWTPMLSRHDN